MKNIKSLSPSLAFTFAFITAFATQASKALIEVTPNHFGSVNSCPSCTVPAAPGDVYGENYGCEIAIVSNVRCTCIYQGGLRDATTNGTGGPSCVALWRYPI